MSISQPETAIVPPTPAKSRRRVKPALKLGLTALVLVMAGRHVSKTWAELQSKGQTLSFDFARLGLALLLYVAGLSACGFYFGRILAATPTPIRSRGALRGYLISHLGKYVPGKALVVVMRVALVRPWGARAASAAIATFYETLVMMASGGLVAAVGFLFGINDTFALDAFGFKVAFPLWFLGFSSALVFLLVVDPLIFPRLGRKATAAFRGVGSDAFPRLTRGLLAEGLAWTALAWILLGLSQVAVLEAMGLKVSPLLIPKVIASVALATVAGFAVPISPGGLGVREWVLWTALGASIDGDLAVVAALTLRLVWFLGEVLASAIVAGIRPRLAANDSPDTRLSES